LKLFGTRGARGRGHLPVRALLAAEREAWTPSLCQPLSRPPQSPLPVQRSPAPLPEPMARWARRALPPAMCPPAAKGSSAAPRRDLECAGTGTQTQSNTPEPRGPLHARQQLGCGGPATAQRASACPPTRVTQHGTSPPPRSQQLPRPWGGCRGLCWRGCPHPRAGPRCRVPTAGRSQAPGGTTGSAPHRKPNPPLARGFWGQREQEAGREGQAGGRRWLMPPTQQARRWSRGAREPPPRTQAVPPVQPPGSGVPSHSQVLADVAPL